MRFLKHETSQQTIFFQFFGTDMFKEKYVQEKKVSSGTIDVHKFMAEKHKDTQRLHSERTRGNWYKVNYRKYLLNMTKPSYFYCDHGKQQNRLSREVVESPHLETRKFWSECPKQSALSEAILRGELELDDLHRFFPTLTIPYSVMHDKYHGCGWALKWIHTSFLNQSDKKEWNSR